MADDLPYMTRMGNINAILQKMQGAGTPPKFTLDFLKGTLGFTASQDRAFPKILKQLRFLNADGTPLPRYNEFKSVSTGGKALAAGLREGWAPIFMADQAANTRTATELKEIFKTVTGQSDSVAEKMASTFKALAGFADWSDPPVPTPQDVGDTSSDEKPEVQGAPEPVMQMASQGVNLHHDIHVHLPPTSDVAVYRAIFRALRDELL